MKPLISEEAKVQAVRNFLIARFNKKAKIASFEPLVPYLEEPRINLLSNLSKSGKRTISPGYGYEREVKYFTELDAEKYFEWLIAVVSDTEHENISEDIVKQANDQLFRFIDVLGDKITMDKSIQLVSSCDGQDFLKFLDERLTKTQDMMDKHDKDIAEFLESILMWIKKYGPILDRMDKEYNRIVKREPKK